MKKLFASIFSLLLICSMFGFAQEKSEFAEESIGLTDADCKNYAKNFKKIDEELEQVGASRNDDDTYSYDEAIKDSEKIDSILAKYGISEPDRYMKLYWISYGYSIIRTQKELEADPVTYKVLKKTGSDPIPAYKASIGESDYIAVLNNYNALQKAFEPDAKEPEKKQLDTSIGGIIGNSIGGKGGKLTGSIINKSIEKKGKSTDSLDYIESPDEKKEKNKKKK